MKFNKRIPKKNGQYRPEFFTEFAVILPVQLISILPKKTKELLQQRGITILEELIQIDLQTFPAGTGLEPLLEKIIEKPYVLEDELRVLKHINDISKIHLTAYEARILLSISAFSFLFNDRDLKSVIEQLLPEYYSEKFHDWRRSNQRNKISKIVYLNAKKISKKRA